MALLHPVMDREKSTVHRPPYGWQIPHCGLVFAAIAACGPSKQASSTGDDSFDAASDSADEGETEDQHSGDGEVGWESDDGENDGSSTPDGDESDGGDGADIDTPRFDLHPIPDSPPDDCADGQGEGCTCTGVDILFVIDNSVSMAPYQEALSAAFPRFVDTMVEVLAPGVSVQVAATSTEMGQATTAVTNGCFGEGTDIYYRTPDTNPTGRPAAQGRLVEVGGQRFARFKTNDPPDIIDGATQWFSRAALLGTSGSNVEMSAAGAGWAADPANDATNTGFFRDAGTVTVVFFVQDEPDQTPANVGGAAMLDKIAARKTECGGTECIIGGGLVNRGCLPSVPLGDMLAGMGAPAVVEQIPDSRAVTPEDFTRVLADSLADVIAEKCKDIPPPTR